MTIGFEGKVAIVTGAGNGLGRSHALELAARGAKVVVNDQGGGRDGQGGSSAAAEEVVKAIRDAGGEAIADGANVANPQDVDAMVAEALSQWGRVDVLGNNAGILRDKSFAKMDMADFKAVVDVHLMGSANCAKANYGAAKMGVVGLMNVLHLEGVKYGIYVNTLSPTAATRMTEDIIPLHMLDLMTVESVTTGLLFLASDAAPSRLILCAGACGYAATRIYETDGIYLQPEEQTPENIAARIEEVIHPEGQALFQEGAEQTMKFVGKAAGALGVELEAAGETTHA